MTIEFMEETVMLTQTMIIRNASRQAGGSALPPSVAASVSFGSSIEMMGAPMPFARNAEIYGENEPAEYLYKVVSGAVRTYKVLERRPPPDRRLLSAGRRVRSRSRRRAHASPPKRSSTRKVLVIKRSALVALAGRDNELARQLWTMTAGELQRVQDHILLLIKTAQERVAGFLLEMAARVRRQRDRAADVASGHRRLSRPHHRDRVAHADPA